MPFMQLTVRQPPDNLAFILPPTNAGELLTFHPTFTPIMWSSRKTLHPIEDYPQVIEVMDRLIAASGRRQASTALMMETREFLRACVARGPHNIPNHALYTMYPRAVAGANNAIHRIYNLAKDSPEVCERYF